MLISEVEVLLELKSYRRQVYKMKFTLQTRKRLELHSQNRAIKKSINKRIRHLNFKIKKEKISQIERCFLFPALRESKASLPRKAFFRRYKYLENALDTSDEIFNKYIKELNEIKTTPPALLKYKSNI